MRKAFCLPLLCACLLSGCPATKATTEEQPAKALTGSKERLPATLDAVQKLARQHGGTYEEKDLNGQTVIEITISSSPSLKPDDLSALKPLQGRLVRLDLPGHPALDDATFKHLTGIKILTLNLEGSSVTDVAAFQAAMRFPELQFLNFGYTKVGDQGVAALANLTELLELRIDQTAVSDAGLVALAKGGVPHRLLSVVQTAVTPFGIGKLQQAKPELVIKTQP